MTLLMRDIDKMIKRRCEQTGDDRSQQKPHEKSNDVAKRHISPKSYTRWLTPK